MIQVTAGNIFTIIIATWLGFALLVGGYQLLNKAGAQTASA